MKKAFSLLFLFPFLVISQGEFNHWHFGSGVAFDFNGGNLTTSNTSAVRAGQGEFVESTATVADCEGNLLVYTDGNDVWNKNNQRMPNGVALDGNSFEFSTQGALIVKRPSTSGIYYIFTASQGKGLKYSIVNMNLNGGLGDVISKNTVLATKGTEKLGVTYHSNLTDIWVVTHYSGSREYQAFLVTRTGVDANGISSFDGVTQTEGHGDLKISQDGSKIGSVLYYKGEVYLADFNNTTGAVSNTEAVFNYNNPHGIEFSPDSKKMYTNSTTGGIIQFLVGGNNAQTLRNSSTIGSSFSIDGSLQLGPDNKIYVTDAGSSYIGVINNPNVIGGGAGFVAKAIFIGGARAGYELTNATLITPNSFNGPNTVSFNETCSNDVTKFSLGVETDVVDLLWEFGDESSVLKNYSTKISPEHEYPGVGTYQGKVEINYACGSEIINFTVVISEAPEFVLSDLVVCSGLSTAIGTGSQANTSYVWSPSVGLSNPNSSNPLLTASSDSEKTTLTYALTATNTTSACSATEEMKVDLTNPIVDAGGDAEFCSEELKEIGTDPREAYAYSWLPSADLVSPSSSKTDVLITNESELTITRIYTLQATFDGCDVSDEVQLRIKPLPKLNLPKDTTICSMDTVVLNRNGNQNTSYQWSSPEGISNTSAASPLFGWANLDSLTNEYQKTVIMINDGCSDEDTVSIKVTPQAGVDDYQYLCPGFGVELNPFGKGVTYLWSPNQDLSEVNIQNPIATPSSSITYYLEVTDLYGCVYDDSVFVDVNPFVPIDLGPDTVVCRDDTLLIGAVGHPLNAVFSWSPPVFLSNPDSNYTFAYPDSSLSYVVMSKSDTCTGYDTLEIIINQLPEVLLKGDTSICQRDSIYLVASGALNYTWSPIVDLVANNDSAFIFPSDTTSYVVEGQDLNGCLNKDTAKVAVRPLPNINLTPDSSVCLTDSIQVFAQGGGSYFWFPNNPETISSSDISNPFLKPTVDTRYVVEVEGLNKCVDSDTIDVTVNSLPVIKMTSDTVICEGTKAYLWATGGVQYKWYPSDDLNADDIPNPESSTTMGENYTVVVTDENNCVDSAKNTVSTNVNPEANFDYSFLASCAGFDVTYQDKSNAADSWFWSFGDGQESKEKSPRHVYAYGRPVITTLVVANNNYCFDTAAVNFNWQKLEDYIKIKAPNVITPNGNKVNDCFELEVEGDFDACTQIEIFNRWGLKVYDEDEFGTCFKGVNEYNFQELSAGTYFYVITINDFIKNGFIQVVR